MAQSWQQVQYPQKSFLPEGDPSEWFDPAWMAAIDQEDHQTQVMPVLPIEYVYWLPYLFFQDEPNNQVNPVYFEAWQNQPTTLMPVYPSEDLYGPRHAFPSFFFEQEPSYFEGFPEAWQNQPTTLMPIYPSEALYASPHLWPYLTMQIARPVFLPDGTGVTSPTKADPVNSGRDDLTIAPL